MNACISEPISWPRLERYALDRKDAGIAAHVEACPACKQCFEEIVRDVVALPPLAYVAPVRRVKWWWFAVPTLAVAAIAVVVLRPRPQRANIASIKGVGEVELSLVRDRGGDILEAATAFKPGDRWKVVLTCAPGFSTAVEIDVTDAASHRVDHPLLPTTIACGNRVVIPGAFELTGHAHNRICARITHDGDTETACVVVTPE
jgi:hypothetical protein